MSDTWSVEETDAGASITGEIDWENAPQVAKFLSEAAKDADVLYTDVWASMGQEGEADERALMFANYRIDQQLVETAAEDALVMHCLPAHRGEEITDAVLDSARSVAFEQAANRMHAQKALLLWAVK